MLVKIKRWYCGGDEEYDLLINVEAITSLQKNGQGHTWITINGGKEIIETKTPFEELESLVKEKQKK